MLLCVPCGILSDRFYRYATLVTTCTTTLVQGAEPVIRDQSEFTGCINQNGDHY